MTVSDGVHTSVAQTVTITPELVNKETPVITANQSFSVNENSPAGTVIGTVIATDSDQTTTLQNWTIISGNEDNTFAINGATGTVTVASGATPDRETTTAYTLTLTVSDGVHTSDAETVTIALNDVNDVVPVITAGQSFALGENNPAGTVVGTVEATDGDITPTTFRDWTITSGNEDNTFAVDASTGEITVAADLDTETTTSYTLMLTVSDGVNTSVVEGIMITVVRAQSTELKIPTAFTPNSDGVNDTWEIDNIAQYPDAVIHVFNRDGREVFRSKGYTNPWDGTWKGKALSFGIYYFIVNLNDASSRTYKGTVMIL